MGSNGLTVANLSTPVFLFYGLLGITLGVGSSILMGKQLGASNVKKANDCFHKVLWIGVVAGISCLAFFVLLQNPILHFLGAEDELLPLAQAYLVPVFYAAPMFVVYHILSTSVRVDGDPKCSAAAAAVVICTNLSLDLIFMQVMQMGIRGASLSLCIAEVLGVVVLLTHFMKKHALLTLQLKCPTKKELGIYISNGFGVGATMLFQGIVMIVFNILLLREGEYGAFYVAVFAVIYTIGLLPGAFFDGGNSALSTVVAIFYGEKDTKSIMTACKSAVRVVCFIGGIFALVFLLFPAQILAVFGLSAQMTDSVHLGIRLFSVSLIFAGIHVVLTGFWQSIGRLQLASGFSIMRNLVLMLIMGAIFIPNMGIVGVGLSYLLTELICFGWSIYLYFRWPSNGFLSTIQKSVLRSYEKYYAIESQSVAQIVEDLEEICEEWDIPMKTSLFLNLIIEELVLNIMKFGLDGSQKQHYVSIKLLENDGEYILRIRDNVKTYNPFDSQGDDIDMGVIRLITTKAKYYDYQRKLIFNYLYLIL